MGTQAAASAVSPTEPARYLRPFPNWDSRCAVTRDFPARFKSGCWSKPNLVMYSLVYFSFLLMLVCWKQVRQFSNKYLCYLFVYNKWLILLTNPVNLRLKWKLLQPVSNSINLSPSFPVCKRGWYGHRPHRTMWRLNEVTWGTSAKEADKGTHPPLTHSVIWSEGRQRISFLEADKLGSIATWPRLCSYPIWASFFSSITWG